MKYCQHYGCRKQAKQRFCSVACRVAFHNARRPAAEKIKITCGACGKVFSGRPDQKTCSATCRSRLFRNRHAASTPDSVSARGAAFEWSRATPFSLSAAKSKVRTRAAQANTDQLLFDFTADRAAPDPSLEASD